MGWKDESQSGGKVLAPLLMGSIMLAFVFRGRIEEEVFGNDTQTIPYTEFIQKANEGGLSKIELGPDNDEVFGWTNPALEDADLFSNLPEGFSAQDAFKASSAQVTVQQDNSFGFFDYLLLAIAGISVAAAAESFGRKYFGKKKPKRELSKEKTNVKFSDIAGIDNIKQEVEEVVGFLKNSKKGKALGVKPPKGILLVGSPGNGKTLLAKAIAGESGVNFFSAAATEFENAFYGESSEQVRDLFKQARRKSPCIIFIDEIDAIGQKRSNRGQSVTDSIVVELLNQLDGFEPLENVIVIAATNRPDVLDPALLRPGRFDRQIVVPEPDVQARHDILKIHVRNKPLATDVDLEEIAKHTYGLSGADLANLVNEAAIQADRRPDAKKIMREDFENALDRIRMGIKSSRVLSEEQRKTTAYHEAGHTLVLLEKEKEVGIAPLHKVTITPHGEALGLTVMQPNEDVVGHTLAELKGMLAVLYGGRIAEEIVFDGIENASTGASNDIQRATDIAWDMVTKYGFSELGAIRFGNGREGFLGPSFNRDLDDYTSAKVYKEVKKIVEEAMQQARSIIESRRDDLEKLASKLMEKETLSRDEVLRLIPYTIDTPRPEL